MLQVHSLAASPRREIGVEGDQRKLKAEEVFRDDRSAGSRDIVHDPRRPDCEDIVMALSCEN